jgi:hypothetical protein
MFAGLLGGCAALFIGMFMVSGTATLDVQFSPMAWRVLGALWTAFGIAAGYQRGLPSRRY